MARRRPIGGHLAGSIATISFLHHLRIPFKPAGCEDDAAARGEFYGPVRTFSLDAGNAAFTEQFSRTNIGEDQNSAIQYASEQARSQRFAPADQTLFDALLIFVQIDPLGMDCGTHLLGLGKAEGHCAMRVGKKTRPGPSRLRSNTSGATERLSPGA